MSGLREMRPVLSSDSILNPSALLLDSSMMTERVMRWYKQWRLVIRGKWGSATPTLTRKKENEKIKI
jgi:hypothetical protein